jgi:hypothetical protein
MHLPRIDWHRVYPLLGQKKACPLVFSCYQWLHHYFADISDKLIGYPWAAKLFEKLSAIKQKSRLSPAFLVSAILRITFFLPWHF